MKKDAPFIIFALLIMAVVFSFVYSCGESGKIEKEKIELQIENLKLDNEIKRRKLNNSNP